MRPPKIKRLYEVMEVDGVKVYAHWSVLLIGAIVSLGAISEPATAILGLICYYGVILLHECGHMVFAQRKHCAVWSIELYPIWGITRFSEPYSLSSPSKWVDLRSSANACVDSRLVSCRAAGYVIHLDHENSYRTLTRATGGGHRSRITRAQDLEVRCGSREAGACSPEAAARYVAQCHR
jgi:hypothetical protein